LSSPLPSFSFTDPGIDGLSQLPAESATCRVLRRESSPGYLILLSEFSTKPGAEYTGLSSTAAYCLPWRLLSSTNPSSDPRSKNSARKLSVNSPPEPTDIEPTTRLTHGLLGSQCGLQVRPLFCLPLQEPQEVA